jgi:hypothetical protein
MSFPRCRARSSRAWSLWVREVISLSHFCRLHFRDIRTLHCRLGYDGSRDCAHGLALGLQLGDLLIAFGLGCVARRCRQVRGCAH